MRLKTVKDKKRRNLFYKQELFKKTSIVISNNRRISLKKRILASAVNTTKVCRNASLTRIKNRCIVSNRCRSVYSKFKVSRIIFREFALKGLFVGVRRSVW